MFVEAEAVAQLTFFPGHEPAQDEQSDWACPTFSSFHLSENLRLCWKIVTMLMMQTRVVVLVVVEAIVSVVVLEV
jgi:hypothetical protein